MQWQTNKPDDGIPELTDSLHEKMKTEFLYTSSCSQGWLWKLPWQVLFPGCLSFVVWLYSDVWLIQTEKALCFHTSTGRTHTTNQMRTYWKFINLTATVFIKIQDVTLEPKWLLRNLTSGCYIMQIFHEFSLDNDISLDNHQIYAPPQTLWDFKVVLHRVTRIQSLHNDRKP